MSLSYIKNENDLKKYLSRHTVVKDSLVPALMDIVKRIYVSPQEVAAFIYSHKFFGKPNIVLNEIESNSNYDLVKSLTQLSIAKRDIALLNKIDKWFPKRESIVVHELFNEELSLATLFECIVIPNNTSRIRTEAIAHVKRQKLSVRELLIFINSMNFVLSISDSPLIKQLRVNFDDDFKLSNYVFDLKRPSDKILLKLRSHFITKAASMIEREWEMMLFFDLLYQSDIAYLKNLLDDKNFEWLRIELELSSLIPFSFSSNFLEWMEVEEMDLWTDFDVIWEGFTNATDSFIFEYYFNLIKLKLIYLPESSDIDFHKILNHPFTAYYIKSLHDLGILNNIPKMAELVDWPAIEDVKLYLKKFDDVSDWNDESPLKRLGYKVGMTSDLTAVNRQKILSHAFLEASQEQLKIRNWGINGSPERLKKIISFLDQRIRIARGYTDRNFDQAIDDWSKDLEFIYSIYYDDKYADEFINISNN